MGTRVRTDNWRWLRAYYFEPCKDDLILDGIWPALGRAYPRPRGQVAYFQRDWPGGPHILLGIGGAAPDHDAAQVVEQVAFAIRAYFEAHPSRTALSPADVSRRMASLRKQEHRAGMEPIAPQPNNSVRIETGEPYSPFLTHDGLKAAVRAFLGATSGFAVSWLRLVRDGTLDRQELCLRLMIALAYVADPERLRAHLSFSSHAQAFLRVRDREGALSRAYAARYDGAGGERVRQLLRTVTQDLANPANPNQPANPAAPADPSTGPAGPLRMNEFVDLLRETLADIYNGLRSGRYQPVPAATLVGDPDRGGAVDYRRLIELLDAHPALRAWQITISLLYQVLNQLGMQAADRFLACYLLSRAAEDVFGEPADRIYQNLNASGDHREMFSFFANLDAAADTAAAPVTG
jgi:hypothetical protein